MTQPIIVLTTCDKREVLTQIANMLVEKKLAACCQIGGPVTSVYRWEGKTENTDEWVCQIKTISQNLDAIVATIKDHHSYEEPEIISLTINGGSQSYLDWLIGESNKG